MHFPKVAILWLQIFLPAISILLTPVGVRALARAQQAHAKALSNFINLRSRSALAAARARHPELYSRLHNRVYKPGNLQSFDRTKRQASFGEGTGPRAFIEQPAFSERWFNPDFNRVLSLLRRENMENFDGALINVEENGNRQMPSAMDLPPSNGQLPNGNLNMAGNNMAPLNQFIPPSFPQNQVQNVPENNQLHSDMNPTLPLSNRVSIDHSAQPHRSAEGNTHNQVHHSAHEHGDLKGAQQDNATEVETGKIERHSATQKAPEMTPEEEAIFKKAIQDLIDNPPGKNQSSPTSQIHDFRDIESITTTTAAPRKNFTFSPELTKWMNEKLDEFKFNQAIQDLIHNPPNKTHSNSTTKVQKNVASQTNLNTNGTVSNQAENMNMNARKSQTQSIRQTAWTGEEKENFEKALHNLIEKPNNESTSTSHSPIFGETRNATEEPQQDFKVSPELLQWMKDKLESYVFEKTIEKIAKNPPHGETSTDVQKERSSPNQTTLNSTTNQNVTSLEHHQVSQEALNNINQVVGLPLDQQKEAMDQLQNMWNMNGFGNNQENFDIIRNQQTLESPEPHLIHHSPKIHSKSFSYVKDKNTGGSSFSYSSYDKWRQAQDHAGNEVTDNQKLSAAQQVDDIANFGRWLAQQEKKDEFERAIKNLVKNPPKTNQEPHKERTNSEEEQNNEENREARTFDDSKLYKIYMKKLKILEKKMKKKPDHYPASYYSTQTGNQGYYDNGGYYRSADEHEGSEEENPELMQKLNEELEEENRNFPGHDPNHPGHVDGRCAENDDKLYKLYRKKLEKLYKKINKKSDSVPVVVPYYNDDQYQNQYNDNYYSEEPYNRNSEKNDQKQKAAEEKQPTDKEPTESQVSAADPSSLHEHKQPVDHPVPILVPVHGVPSRPVHVNVIQNQHAFAGATEEKEDQENDESMLENEEKSAREPHFKGGFTHSHTHFFQKDFGGQPILPNLPPQPVQINLNQNSFASAAASASGFANQQQAANGFTNAGSFQPWENSGGFAQANSQAQANAQNIQPGFINSHVKQQQSFAQSNAQSSSNNFQGVPNGASAQAFAQAQANSFNQSPVTFGLGPNTQSFSGASANAGTANQWVGEPSPIHNEEVIDEGESLNNAPKFARSTEFSKNGNNNDEMSFVTNIVDQSLRIGNQMNDRANSENVEGGIISQSVNSGEQSINDQTEEVNSNARTPKDTDLEEEKKNVFDTMNFVTGIVDFGINEHEKNKQRSSGSVGPLPVLFGDSFRLKRQMEMNSAIGKNEQASSQPENINRARDQSQPMQDKNFFLMQERMNHQPNSMDEHIIQTEDSNNFTPLLTQRTSQFDSHIQQLVNEHHDIVGASNLMENQNLENENISMRKEDSNMTENTDIEINRVEEGASESPKNTPVFPASGGKGEERTETSNEATPHDIVSKSLPLTTSTTESQHTSTQTDTDISSKAATKAGMLDIIRQSGVSEVLKSIDEELKMLTPEQKQEFIKQELELLTEMIADSLKRNESALQDSVANGVVSTNGNRLIPSEPLVSRPNLFQAPYDTTSKARESFYNRQEYSRSADNFDAVLGMQHDAVQNLKANAKNDGDLLMISWIGEGIVKDLETRRDKAVAKRKRQTLESDSPSLTKIVGNPNTKIDIPKTLDNFGAVTRNLIENSKAPLYHVRNMVGNAKNSVMAAVKTAPNNLIIPSKYEITNTDNDRKLGSINRKLLKEKIIEKAEQKKNSNKDNFGIADTFHKLGSILKDSVDSGKQTVAHANDLAIDARNALYTAKHAVPRIVSPLNQLPGFVGESTPDSRKTILLAPRILDVSENQDLLGADTPGNNEQFLGLGEILDSVGVTNPDMKHIEVEKVLLQPASIQVLERWNDERPKALRSKWRKSNLKGDRPNTDKTDKLGMSNTIDTIETLDDTEQAFGAENLKNLFKDMRLQMKNAIRDHVSSITKRRKKLRKAKILKKYRGIPLRKEADLSELASKQQKSDKIPNIHSRMAEFNFRPEDRAVAMSLNHGIMTSNENLNKDAQDFNQVVDKPEKTFHSNGNIAPSIITDNENRIAITVSSESPKHAFADTAKPNTVVDQQEAQPSVINPVSTELPKDVDEQVRLYLPPELMKPFMGRASESELNTFRRENNDVENTGSTENVGKSVELDTTTTDIPTTPTVSTTTQEYIHRHQKVDNEALTHILGAMDPRMFEKMFNERFQAVTRSQIGSDKQPNNVDNTNQSDLIANQPVKNEEHNMITNESIKKTVTKTSSEISERDKGLNLDLDEDNRPKFALIDGEIYKKPFMGTLDKKLIKKFLKQYNHIEDSSEEDSYRGY